MEEISIYNQYYDKTFKYKVFKRTKNCIDFLLWSTYLNDWNKERLFKNKHGVWCVSNASTNKRWWVIATTNYIQLVEHLTSEATS